MEKSRFSQRSENFEKVCVMLQKIIEYLNTNKGYSNKIFIKFEKDEGYMVLKFHFVYILLRFSLTFWTIPIMNH